jgi:hypothetical protein
MSDLIKIFIFAWVFALLAIAFTALGNVIGSILW